MKILFLGGNLAKCLADWLQEQGEEVVYKEDKMSITEVKEISPEMIVSYNYKYIISKEVLDAVNGKAINLHISYLPWNKGAYPNIWSFLEDTPKAITIHYLDEGIDTGDIIIQKEVQIDEEKETLKSSYEILHKEIQTLFKENWSRIKNNKIVPEPQMGGGYTLRESFPPSNHSLKKKDGIPLLENLKKNINIGDVVLKNFINLTTEEKEMILRWRNDENVRVWMYSNHVISHEEHFKFMEGLQQENKNLYWLIMRKNKEYLGIISLNKIDLRNKNAYLGIYSNPELSGIGGAIMECLKKLAFGIAHLHTLKAEVIETNKRAINFYKKAGFSEEGRLKKFVFKDGRWQDVMIMGIINPDIIHTNTL